MAIEKKLNLKTLQSLLPIYKLKLATEADANRERHMMARSGKPLDEGSVVAVDQTGKNFAAFRKGKPVIISGE